MTDMTPHFVLVARVVAVGVDDWDFEGRHEVQIVKVSAPIPICPSR